MKRLLACVMVGGALALLASSGNGGGGEPKYTIKEVMKMAHKDGLLKTVQKGDASKDERKELVELYTALSKNKPPKGDEDDWKKRTGAMVKGAKSALKDAEAGKMLKVNCGACHKLHK